MPALQQQFVAANEEVDGLAGVKGCGGFQLYIKDWGLRFPRRVIFGGVIAASDGGLTTTLRLFNIDQNEVITASALNTSNTTPTLVETSPMTLADIPGLIRPQKGIYEVRIETDGTLVSDLGILGSAYLIFLP